MRARARAPATVDGRSLKGAGFDATVVVSGLAVAALIELLILRSGTRTAIHIPALESLAGPYRALSWAARYSYYVAGVLLITAIPVVAASLWRERGLVGKTAAGAVAAFVVSATLARLGWGSALLLDLAMTSSVAVLAVTAASGKALRALAVSVFGTAFLLAAGFSLAQHAVALNELGSFDGRWMLRLAEPLALGFALSLPWTITGQLRRRDWGIGLAAGVLLFTFFLAEPATARFLLLWNEGLAGSYPGFLYALAGGAGVVSVSGLIAQRRLPEAAALALLVAGGIGLHSTYQTGLVVVGLAVLCGTERRQPPGGSQPSVQSFSDRTLARTECSPCPSKVSSSR